MNDLQTKQSIEAALKAFSSQVIADAAIDLFKSLGYTSNKRLVLNPNTREQFLATFGQGKTLNDKLALSDDWKSIDFLFQLTNDEVLAAGPQQFLFDDAKSYDGVVIESYLFLALELKGNHYTRSALAGITRELNKLFAMPALILFRHGDTLTLAIIHRRLNKRDQTRDVLEKVTLIKDIAFADPIRAHLEILNDFGLAKLNADFGIANFVALHTAWQTRLSSYELSNTFYHEIADWYFWAQHLVDDGTIQLPMHCDTEQEKSLFLIRLLTRVIFCWFLVEKRLVPAELFRDYPLKKLLKDISPNASTYYHAVLQNLFFGTLNMPVDQRGFREKKNDSQRYDQNYGITNLWRYEIDFRDHKDWITLAARVPFLNGGLFDCLDEKLGKDKDNSILDGFSDNPKLTCHLPNDLFFGQERIVDLSRDYGDEDSRTARSKKAKVRGLIEILSHYKFTVEENTPLEEEIALDPELLGKVFENLLASYNEDTRTTARKALGAFYTPREIVAYMVDESLKSYLATQVPRVKGLLDGLFANKATLKDIKPDQRGALVAAIGRVKILDPACGSGAFPMGALNRLVEILKRLDEDNSLWQDFQRRRAVAETDGAFKAGDHQARELRLKEINDTFEFNTSDYGRKLYLIENSIYGVDIQPIAVQIAKLRFFITLVVDQKVDTQKANLGVRPLPNLETRLVAADTLIPIEKAKSDLFSSEIDKLRDELAHIRHEHFSARSPSDKRKWRAADAAKRQEIANLLEREHTLPRISARLLAAWDPYDQNTFAPFFDSKWMFGLAAGKAQVDTPSTIIGHFNIINEAGGQTELAATPFAEDDSGFDIVIGNPPYIRIQTLKKKDPELVAFYKAEYASAAKGNYDLYVVFIEAGLRLLKSDGYLAYICPHKFFNAQYGEPLRKIIGKGRHLRHIVHFGDEQVFSGATIYTCLLFLANGGSADFRFVQASNLESWKTTLAGSEGRIQSNLITGAEWNFAVGRGSQVFATLQAMPLALGQIADLFVGVQTDADDVFILEALHETSGIISCHSKFLNSEWDFESEHLKPFLKGSLNIRRYHFSDVNKRLLFPYETVNGKSVLISGSDYKRRFPKTWKYLEKCKTRLESRANGNFTDFWHGYVYRKNHTKLDQPKIVVPAIGNQACFAADLHGSFYFVGSGGGGGGGYGIVIKAEAKQTLISLLGILNSPIATYFLKKVSTTFRGGYFAMNKQFIEQIPIPNIALHEADHLGGLSAFVNYLTDHFMTSTNTQIARDPLMLAYYEQILNGLIYELYFPEELHTAGLFLFSLVEQASLPILDSILEGERLIGLRRLFETLHDGFHPLKIALQKLQTLDVVRIIEGKA